MPGIDALAPDRATLEVAFFLAAAWLAFAALAVGSRHLRATGERR